MYLTNLQVLGQLDNKFICCSTSTSENGGTLLVLIDQHAAHERIRLEKLTSDAFHENRIKTVTLKPSLELKLDEHEVRIMSTFQEHMSNIGVSFVADSKERDVIHIHTIPSCLVQRDVSELKRGRSPVVVDLLESLLKEHVELLEKTHGACGNLPRSLSKVLNSQACHGAIKFGDPLTLKECKDLVSSLAQCNLPFQCAHGRPSIVPLLDFGHLNSHYPSERRKRPCLPKLGHALKVAKTLRS